MQEAHSLPELLPSGGCLQWWGAAVHATLRNTVLAMAACPGSLTCISGVPTPVAMSP